MTTVNAYFGAKLVSKGTPGGGSTSDNVALIAVVADRLGSIGKFYPYGQEKPSATGNDTEKFTGYYRDAATGLDYADQRYHQPGMGRFMSPDPSGSASSNSPGSMNQYAYVQGDPINRTDHSGLDCEGYLDDPSCFGGITVNPSCYGYDPGNFDPGCARELGAIPFEFSGCPVGDFFNAFSAATEGLPCLTPEEEQAFEQQEANPPLSCTFTDFRSPGGGWHPYPAFNGSPAYIAFNMPTEFTFTAFGGDGVYIWQNRNDYRYWFRHGRRW